MSSDPHSGNGNPPKEVHTPGLLRYRAPTEPGRNRPSTREHYQRLADIIGTVWVGNTLEAGDAQLVRHPAINVDRLRGWHKELLFELEEPAEVIGRFREYGEQSIYEVWEDADIAGDQPRCAHLQGLLVERDKSTIEDAVRNACSALERAVDQPEEQHGLYDAVAPPATLYLELLRIRPFVVANDSIAYLALQAAYSRLGLDRLLVAPRAGMKLKAGGTRLGTDFNHAIGRSLQPKRPSTTPLIEFLVANSAFL